MSEVVPRPPSPEPVKPPSPDQLEDDAVDEAKTLPVTAVEEPSDKPRNPRVQYPKLNAAALLNPDRGLPKLMEMFADRKWQGRGYEANNLNHLIFHPERWAKQLYPRWAATDTIERVEELGKKREVKVFAKKIFEDTPTCLGMNADGTPVYVLDAEANDDGETLSMNRKLRGFHGDIDDADEDVFALLNQAMGGGAQDSSSDGQPHDLIVGEPVNSNNVRFKKRKARVQEEDDPDEDVFALLDQAMGVNVPNDSPSSQSNQDNGPVDSPGSSSGRVRRPNNVDDDDAFGLLREPTNDATDGW